MADKTTELERIYTVPLTRAKHGTRSKRANRAIGDVRNFMNRHMKSENVWISNEVNELIWARGKFMIPSKIRVRATRFSDGVVEVTLTDAEVDGSVRQVDAARREEKIANPVLAAPDMGELDGEDAEEGDSEEETVADTDSEEEVVEASGDSEEKAAEVSDDSEE
jgi:large subunit ribosomal protein L31e